MPSVGVVWRSAFALQVCLVSLAAAADPGELPALPSPLAPGSLLLDIEVSGERIVSVGEQGFVVYRNSADTGWQNASVPVSLMLTAVDFPSAARGYAVGHDGIVLRSDDGGENWRPVLDGRRVAELQLDEARRRRDRLQQAVDAMDPDAPEYEDAEFELENAEFDVEDAEMLVDEGITSPMLDVLFVSDERGLVAGAYGVLLETTNGGDDWVLLSGRLDNPDRNHLYSVTRTPAGHLFIAGEAGVLFRSTDDGESWQRLSADYPGSLFGIVALSDTTLVTHGLQGRLFRTTDGGDNWSPIETDGRATMMGGRYLADGRLILVGAGGNILVSRDQGRSFDAVESPSRETLASVALGPNGKLLIAGFGGVRTLALSDTGVGADE